MRLSDAVKEFLINAQGKEVSLSYLRKELRIDPKTTAWDNLRMIMVRLADEKVVKPSGRNDGVYKVIVQVRAVKVAGRERHPPIILNFPKDKSNDCELMFARDIIVREGDMILISGMSNFGKTAVCMNFCAENIDTHPVLMGNEYTTVDNEPLPRFLDRLDRMNWVKWANENGEDNFTLLPVRADYAEHIVKDRINIIDWINLPGEYYMISKVMEDIKRELGKGVAIIALQKNEGSEKGRGGDMTKDFADVEFLIDKHADTGKIRLTLGKVKEAKSQIAGRTYTYRIVDGGTKIWDFVEVVKCPQCHGKGWNYNKPCDTCKKTGFVEEVYEEPDES